MKIRYFNRGVKSGFSIHRVFDVIVAEVAKNCEVEVFNVPEIGVGLRTFRNNLAFVKKHRSLDAINHVTGEVNYLALSLKGHKSIVTVHDIGLMREFTGIKKALWNLWWIQTLKRADMVTFISEYTMNEVLKYIFLPKSKMVIVPNPVSPDFVHKPKEFNSIKPVILHVGTGANKNLAATIEALEGISCHIRIIGKISKDIVELLSKHNVEYSNGVKLSNQEVLMEYENSDIVNFPSTHEGFGMPILEGQAVGRVVVTSNLSPMNQVCGVDGAFLIDPYDLKSIRNAYKQIIADVVLRDRLINGGLENVKNYSADVVAKKYIKVYKELLK